MIRLSKKFLIALLLIGCILSLGCNSNLRAEQKTHTSAYDSNTEKLFIGEKQSGSLLECNFYDEREFNLFDIQSEPYDVENEIWCGVVPHHLLAGKMIASFFKTASENRQNEIDTVVIIAPIHEPKSNKICTTLSDWEAPTGTLSTDKGLSEKFVTKLNAAEDDEMLQSDHSASGLIPFVKYYFPSASVSCLLVSRTADDDTPERVSELLAEFSKEKSCLFVFSVDFSHYLNPDEAANHDDETLKAVMDNDLESISKMGNSNMDSPYCVSTFLRLNDISDGQVQTLDHSNSFEILGLPYTHPSFNDGVTSYFIFAGIR
ncbi:MAG TPA: AmmeMemoRadiSam system protein B [Oscillospiraceae bacterium]|nr:AmmeMemoRadiSam system protein B [Oscillospiraceae bacterium]